MAAAAPSVTRAAASTSGGAGRARGLSSRSGLARRLLPLGVPLMGARNGGTLRSDPSGPAAALGGRAGRAAGASENGDGTGPRRVRRSLGGAGPSAARDGQPANPSTRNVPGKNGRHDLKAPAVIGSPPPSGSGRGAGGNADGPRKRVVDTITRAGTKIYSATELDTAEARAIEDPNATLRGARKSLETLSASAKSTKQRTKDRAPDHLSTVLRDGIRQGVPLARLLEFLPEIPAPDAITLTSCHEHLSLYDTLVENGRLHNALELIRVLRSAGLKTVGSRVSHKAFLRQAARRRAVAVAFEFVAFVNHPDIRLYNMLLSVCAAAADSRSGFAALVLMYDAGVVPDCRAYTTLISACAKSGELDKAFETFRRMRMDNVEPSVVTYGALMDALSRRVLELTSAADLRVPDPAGASDVAREVGSLLDRCFDLREEMDDAGFTPDATLLNSLLSACARAAAIKPLAAAALDKAFTVYDEMEHENSRLICDAYTYASLIKACVNAGEPERALSLYDSMAHPQRERPVERTPTVYTAALHACAMQKPTADLAKALEIWRDVREARIQPDAMLYATLMDVAGRAGESEVADRVMFEMERDGVTPTPEVFSTLAGIAAKAGDVTRVEDLLDEMTDRGTVPSLSTFNALIAAAARAGDCEAADDAAARLTAAGLTRDAKSYEGLVYAAAMGGEPQVAWKYYEQAIHDEVEVTLPVFNALIIASGRAGELRRAFHAVDEMRHHGHEPDHLTWRELLSACARSGDAGQAWDIYKQSRKAGIPPNEVALNIIVGVTLLKIRELTDPDNLAAAAEAAERQRNGSEPEWKKWADRAIAAYHEATVAGVTPRIETFSAMLACLRPPTLPALRAVDREANGSKAQSLAYAAAHEDSSHEDAKKYYPLRALIMYEEAQALGVVPKFRMEDDSVYDLRAFPPAAAEVAVLTLLRVFRRYSDSHAGEGEVELPNVTLRLLSDEEHEELVSAPDGRSSHRLARTGDRVVVLLRRLRFNYGGSLSHGRIELSGNVIGRWLKAKPPAEGLPGMEPRLAGALQDQARNIRAQSMFSDDGGESPWSQGGYPGYGGAPAGGSRGRGMANRGLGSGSSIDFFGASDPRYSYSSGDSQDDNYSGYGRKWVSTGWVQEGDDDDDGGMMGELNRIINQ